MANVTAGILNRYCGLIAVLGLVLSPRPSLARVAKAKPPTPQELVGTYESISIVPLAVLVLTIDGSDAGKVRLIEVSGPGEPVVAAFKGTEFKSDSRGHIAIHLRGVAPNQDLSAELKLTATPEGQHGSMRGTIAIWSGERDRTRSRVPIVFAKNSETVARWILDARARADELLQNASPR
jgi:hypothetical protein